MQLRRLCNLIALIALASIFCIPGFGAGVTNNPAVDSKSDQRIDRLKRWLKSEDPSVRTDALVELSGLRHPETLQLVHHAAADSNGAVRVAAARAIKILNDPRSVPTLRGMLRDPVYDVRGTAVWALSYVGGKAALADIIRLAQEDSSGVVRFRAVWSLGIVGDKVALPVAVDALADENASVRDRAAVLALESLADQTIVTRLLEMASNNRPATRRIVMYLLGKHGNERAIPGLEHGLRDDNALVRAEAARSLGRLKATTAVPALVTLVADNDEHVRGTAAFALGLIGDKSAAGAVRPLLQDKAAFVRAIAAETLHTLGDDTVKPPPGFKSADLFTFPIRAPEHGDFAR